MSKTIKTDLICPECGNIFTIMREVGKQRNQFHRKWLYCLECKKKTDHIEVKDLDLLLKKIEFKGEGSRTADENKILKLVKKGKKNDYRRISSRRK